MITIKNIEFDDFTTIYKKQTIKGKSTYFSFLKYDRSLLIFSERKINFTHFKIK